VRNLNDFNSTFYDPKNSAMDLLGNVCSKKEYLIIFLKFAEQTLSGGNYSEYDLSYIID
jgi:hypothetical protein